MFKLNLYLKNELEYKINGHIHGKIFTYNVENSIFILICKVNK